MKEQYLQALLRKSDYMKLANTNADEKMEKAIDILKEDYIKTATKYRFSFDQETKEFLNHSEQSEILGKIVMLSHEFGGYKLVMENITELNFKIHDLVNEAMVKMENKIKEFESGEVV